MNPLYIVNYLFSRVYCEGSLFETIQNAHLFHDSKDFVDMPLINSPGNRFVKIK